MPKNRPTVGKISSDLSLKAPETRNPIDLERAMHGDYVKNVLNCVDSHRNQYLGDFFVVVITKREPLMQNVLRNYFFARASCPTPDYDQAVYHFKRNDDLLNFLWVIPSKDACLHLREHASEVEPSEWQLLDFVLKFADGTLYKESKKLNNEASDSALLNQ